MAGIVTIAMINIYSQLKKYIPKTIKKFIRYSFPFLNNSVPYKFREPSFKGFNVSDFFLFRCDNYETIFVAENNLALVLAEPIVCHHKFYFFNKFGNRCGFFEVSDDSFHYNLNINKKIVGGEELGSFIHQTGYLNSDLKKLISLQSKSIIFQHRGYTGFRRSADESPIFSFVHGNFGAMYIDNKNKVHSLSTQRKKHFYTPQIIIKPGNSYDFFFNNPGVNKLSIKIILFNKANKLFMDESVVINSLSSYRFNLSDSYREEDLNISWETHLPIGRAIVFEYQGSSFDVYHS